MVLGDLWQQGRRLQHLLGRRVRQCCRSGKNISSNNPIWLFFWWQLENCKAHSSPGTKIWRVKFYGIFCIIFHEDKDSNKITFDLFCTHHRKVLEAGKEYNMDFPAWLSISTLPSLNFTTIFVHHEQRTARFTAKLLYETLLGNHHSRDFCPVFHSAKDDDTRSIRRRTLSRFPWWILLPHYDSNLIT